MRILVDTSVWIDFFRGRKTVQTQKLVDCIERNDDLCLCGFILTEALQGVADERAHKLVRQHLDNLIYLPDNRTTFELAATIYREVRGAGHTIRNTMDCLIAAMVVQHGVSLLENDRDYRYIDQHYPLNRL